MGEIRSNIANFQSYFKFWGDEALMENEYKDYLMDSLAEGYTTSIIMQTFELGSAWESVVWLHPWGHGTESLEQGPIRALFESLLWVWASDKLSELSVLWNGDKNICLQGSCEGWMD